MNVTDHRHLNKPKTEFDVTVQYRSGNRRFLAAHVHLCATEEFLTLFWFAYTVY